MNQLNQGQEAASLAFTPFLLSDAPFFAISGPAGKRGRRCFMAAIWPPYLKQAADCRR